MTTRDVISFPASSPPTAAPQVAAALRNSTSTTDVPVVRSDLSPTISAIVAELQRTFFGIVPAAAVAQCATRAVQDLLGSICLQALPEMAIRLATVRLQTGRLESGAVETGVAPPDTDLSRPAPSTRSAVNATPPGHRPDVDSPFEAKAV